MSEALSHYPSIGRKIERIRKIKGIKQETLARQLGVTPQAVSKMEQSETIDDEKLERVAEALGVTAEAIRNYNEETAVNLFNTISNNAFEGNTTGVYQVYQNFNPIEKIVELYERMLELEREKVAILQSELDKRK